MSHHHRVLVVEDNTDVAELLQVLLDSEGFDSLVATDGAVALAHLRRDPAFCLILLDLMMPVMDGWTFRIEQRRDPRLAEIPVVLLSGDGRVREKAAQLDVADHMLKPLDVDRLVGVVERFCHRRPEAGA
jgi:CheY-like chemotaxis protein